MPSTTVSFFGTSSVKISPLLLHELPSLAERSEFAQPVLLLPADVAEPVRMDIEADVGHVIQRSLETTQTSLQTWYWPRKE